MRSQRSQRKHPKSLGNIMAVLCLETLRNIIRPITAEDGRTFFYSVEVFRDSKWFWRNTEVIVSTQS